jgi:radical SAM superfamily enzyme YgiQ (UPF0313 family)
MEQFKVLLVYPNLMLVSTLPNNIALLSACLKKDGNDVNLFDATLYCTAEKSNDEMRVERMQVRRFNIKEQGVSLKESNIFSDFKNIVDSYQPDLIGVTVVDDTVRMGLELIHKAECRQKGIPVIIGGIHAYFNAEYLIHNNVVDMVCIGEGEETLVEVCRCLRNKVTFKDVPNLLYKKNDGSVQKNFIAPPLDINKLPFEDFSIFEEQRFYRPMQGKIVKTLPLNFDRGCPYNCTFCDAPAIKNIYKHTKGLPYFRQKTIPRIYEEIKFQLDQYEINYMYFNSETFLAMPLKKIEEFAEMYSEFNLPFWCQTRIETVSDKKIKLLKEMNCDRISVGIEHGNEHFRRKILKKNFTNAQVVKAFEIFNKNEIKVSVNNIIGFPDETRELIFDTIKLNRQIKVDSVNGFIFQPYTGTELEKYCIEKGYYLSPDIMSREEGTPIGESVLNMPQISKDELNGLLRTFVLYVKMPESYYPKIKKAEQLNKEGDAVLAELRDIFFEKFFN